MAAVTKNSKTNEIPVFSGTARYILLNFFFSSPEPKAPGELIGWEGSIVRRPSSSSVHNFKLLLL